MIEIQNVSFGYNLYNQVINDINLSIKRNQKITVIGKSGCGKTTLLYLLASILKPVSGEISINQQKLVDMRKETSIIFQNNGLFPWKTVYGNLMLGLKSKNLPQPYCKDKINSVLDELNIDVTPYEKYFAESKK